jgi:hypothetical protein
MKSMYGLLGGVLLWGFAGATFAADNADPHLPAGQTVQNEFQLSDKLGYVWDIRCYDGSINQGTNYVYSNGLRLYVNGSNLRSNNGQAVLSKDGEEIEVQMRSQGNLKVHRRIRIFREHGVARFLDILQNTSGQPQDVRLMIQSHINYGIRGSISSSGDATVDPKEDFAFITQVQQHNNCPSLLHMLGSPDSEVRPESIQHNGNQLMVNYSLSVPENETVILVYFEAQNRSEDDLKKLMNDFPTAELLADLDPAVQNMILNFDLASSSMDISLARNALSDVVLLRNEQPMYGKIVNESFVMQTQLGEVTLPAERIVGMATTPDQPDRFRVLLVDGQILGGTLDRQTLTLDIPAAGTQTIPLADLWEWSFQVSDARPERPAFEGPYLRFRNGDRLAFDGTDVTFALHTQCGPVSLRPEHLQMVLLDPPDANGHKALFRNGSSLSGLLDTREMNVPLRNWDALTFQPSDLVQIECSDETARTKQSLTVLTLANGDELRGQLTEPMLQVTSEYGEMNIKSANIVSIERNDTIRGTCRVTIWNGSVLDGTIQPAELAFAITPGPSLKIHPVQIANLTRPRALPPEKFLAKAETLIAQLAAESYQDRKSAQQQLRNMGQAVIPVLERHRNNPDAEIRQRIEELLEALGAKPSSALPTDAPGLQA